MNVLKIKDNGTWYDVTATSVVEESNSIYLTNVPISAVTGDIASIIDSRITSESAVAEVTFANPSAITSDVTWITGNGSLVLNGTCTSATTANIVIVHVLDGSAPTNNGVIMVRLWTNANPSSNFAAQALQIDVSAYDFLAVEHKVYASLEDRRIDYGKVGTKFGLVHPAGGGGYFSTASSQQGMRGVDTTTTTKIVFGSGYASAGGANFAAADSRCIPTEIYGIKI